MATLPRSLSIILGDIPVGLLSLDRNDGVEFRWLRSYLEVFPRPVFGQHFLDDPDSVLRSRSRLPPWFSNLLPEGALFALIAKQAGLQPVHEYALLNMLGQDLPGAVRVLAADDMAAPVEADTELSDQPPSDEAWHFSLAGMQLKFSAQRTGRGLTIPVSGLGGDWIVKLPDARFNQVPANEFATTQWRCAPQELELDLPQWRDGAAVTRLRPGVDDSIPA